MKRKVTLFLLLADGLLLLYWGLNMENMWVGIPIGLAGVMLMCYGHPFRKGFTDKSLFEGVCCFLSVCACGGFFYGLTFTEEAEPLFPGMPERFVLNAVALLSLLVVMVVYRLFIRIAYNFIYRDVPGREPLKPISKAPLIAAAFMMFSLLSNMPGHYFWDLLGMPPNHVSMFMMFISFFPMASGIVFYYLLKYIAGIDRPKKPDQVFPREEAWPQRFRGTYIGD